MSNLDISVPPALRNPLGLPTLNDPMSLLVMNNKGGVGKSTLIREMLMMMALWRLRSRGVDMDPQANLSRRLGFGPEWPDGKRPPTLAEAIKADEEGCGEDILVPATWEVDGEIVEDEYIDLLPSSLPLDNREAEAGMPAASSRLANIMRGMDPAHFYGYDCRPSVGHLTQQAMIAAGQTGRAGVIIVTEPEQDGVNGACIVADFVESYAARLGVPHLKVIGVVINRYRANTLVHQDGVEALKERFGDKVWEPYLPLRTILAVAQDAAHPLAAYKEAEAKHMRQMIYQVTHNMLEAM
jgi:cellulose biosynthesis protein BcsQ